MNDVEKTVRDVMSVVFKVGRQSIDTTASPDTIESWDSLHHINLILALEEELGIQFSLEEIEFMQDYKTIVELVSRRLNGGRH